MCWGSIEEVNKRVNSFLANVSSLYTPENTRKSFLVFSWVYKKENLDQKYINLIPFHPSDLSNYISYKNKICLKLWGSL